MAVALQTINTRQTKKFNNSIYYKFKNIIDLTSFFITKKDYIDMVIIDPISNETLIHISQIILNSSYNFINYRNYNRGSQKKIEYISIKILFLDTIHNNNNKRSSKKKLENYVYLTNEKIAELFCKPQHIDYLYIALKYYKYLLNFSELLIQFNDIIFELPINDNKKRLLQKIVDYLLIILKHNSFFNIYDINNTVEHIYTFYNFEYDNTIFNKIKDTISYLYSYKYNIKLYRFMFFFNNTNPKCKELINSIEISSLNMDDLKLLVFKILNLNTDFIKDQLQEKIKVNNVITINLTIKIIDNNFNSKITHENSVTIFKTNENILLAIRCEPHRLSSCYCRNTVRKIIREYLSVYGDKVKYIDHIFDDLAGLQIQEENKILSSNFSGNQELRFSSINNTNQIYKTQLSPLQGLDCLCIIWSLLHDLLLRMNNQSTLEEIAEYFSHETTKKFNKLYNIVTHKKKNTNKNNNYTYNNASIIKNIQVFYEKYIGKSFSFKEYSIADFMVFLKKPSYDKLLLNHANSYILIIFIYKQCIDFILQDKFYNTNDDKYNDINITQDEMIKQQLDLYSWFKISDNDKSKLINLFKMLSKNEDYIIDKICNIGPISFPNSKIPEDSHICENSVFNYDELCKNEKKIKKVPDQYIKECKGKNTEVHIYNNSQYYYTSYTSHKMFKKMSKIDEFIITNMNHL